MNCGLVFLLVSKHRLSWKPQRSSEKLSDDLKYILFRQEQKLASSGRLSLSPKYCEEASSRIDTENQRGWRRLALNSTPIPKDFKLLRRCAEVNPKFAFFQEQRERFAIDSVVFSQDAFCLIPKFSMLLMWFWWSASALEWLMWWWIKPLTPDLS